MDKKYLLYGGIGLAVVAAIIIFRGGGNSSTTGQTAIVTAGTMAGAAAANNAAAYDYLAKSAESTANAKAGMYATNSLALSDFLKSIVGANAAIAISNRDSAAERAQSVAAVRIASYAADTQQLISNNQYLLGKQELENDAKFIGIQLPLAQIQADATQNIVRMTTAADQNIAQINATRDVQVTHEQGTADTAIAGLWANAAIQQAYYGYKAAKAAAQAAASGFGFGGEFALPGGAGGKLNASKGP